MLIAALFFLLFSSHAGDFQVYDIEKPVKQYVVDTAKVKQILAINKAMLSEEADFNKNNITIKKQLAKINENRLAAESEFADAFTAIDAKRAAVREKILDDRFKMKALMTAEEWNQVYAKTSQEN